MENVKIFTPSAPAVATERKRKRIKHKRNKLVSLILIGIGIITALLTLSFEGKADLTVFIFMAVFAVPLFFAKRNYISWH